MASCSTSSRPPSSRPRRTRSSLVSVSLLCLLLFSGVFANLTVAVPQVFAAGPKKPPVVPASHTMKQFLQQGRSDTVYRGPLQKVPRGTSAPLSPHDKPANYTKLPPSAEPAKMIPIVQTLDQDVVAGAKIGGRVAASGGATLDVKSSDGRLEVQIQASSLDLSQAVVPAGKGTTAASGTLSLHITQLHGHYVGQINLLGAYQVEVRDAQQRVVSGVKLLKPVTFLYHYQVAEVTALDLDPGHLVAVWPTLLASAQQAKQPTSDFVLPMTNDAKAHTLTAQSNTLGPAPLDVGGGDAQNQSPPTPHLASVGGNAGQLTYGYPLQVPPGPAGFSPQLSLSYSSSGPNERHSRTSPAGSAGDGWSLSLGSISADTYPSGAAPGTWYFLSGVANTGDRLIQDTTITTGTYYQTEHVSRLKIQRITSVVTNQICFHVWDTSGTAYELGCTADSLQYRTDSTGQHNYRWDLDRIIAPNEGPNANYKLIQVFYLQDKATVSGYTSVRDAAIKQIVYGTSYGSDYNRIGTYNGTVDFSYLAPTASAPWATAYGNNYNCSSAPPTTTTLRCDDPNPADGGSIPAPSVMSTLTLQSVTSYVGSDSTGSKAYGYSMSYQDGPYSKDGFTRNGVTTFCKDPYTLIGIDCSGEHLLTKVVPHVYQNGTAHDLKPLLFTYSGGLQDVYFDSQHTVQNGTQPYGGQTFWQYLTDYVDSNTGVGGHIDYGTAFGNTHGTPYVVNGSNVDDRHNPLYCWVHRNDPASTQCVGAYLHPEERAWSQQVVTQTRAWGTDSSATALQPATTTYAYRLAVVGGATCPTGTGTGTAPPGQTDCVVDSWIPTNSGAQDTDWQDYYHSEFHGFNVVAITSPAKDLTVDSYFSTEGWGTPNSNSGNYNSGHLFEEDVYAGNAAVDSALLSKKVNTYTLNPNSCIGVLSPVYNPCEVMILKSRTTQYDGTGSGTTNAPWTQHDYTYDDFNPNTGGGLTAGYHNMTRDVTTSSNASTLTKKWSYSTNDTTDSGGWVYYTVDKAKQSEVDDSSGHIWQCVSHIYDEGAPAGNITPSAGWLTTAKTYNNSDCAAQTNPSITAYTDYDVYGNVVAGVDGVAQATPSLYTSKGCTLATKPALMSAAWTASTYTACTTYDSNAAMPLTSTNALAQQSSNTYDSTQGLLPTVQQDANGQQTKTAYSFDTNSGSNGKHTVQVSQPGETGAYTSQSSTNSTCASSIPGSTT